MGKVALFSALLIAGLLGSQLLPGFAVDPLPALQEIVRLLTMLCLGFIMIHVGYEFEIDRANIGAYAVDYGVAATAAAFPWIFCAIYFVFVLDSGPVGEVDTWRDALLTSRFAAPTSAGILFSMLAAAGLSASWVFAKARVLAIFDDLDTVLLMIPLKMWIVGMQWQLAAIAFVMGALLWLAWRYLHAVRLPITWPWVVAYAAAITAACEALYLGSKLIDELVPIHIEVLLPAFVLGCVLARPVGHDPHADDQREGHQDGPEAPNEQRVATIISGVFMILVGLSMPAISAGTVGWGALAVHTVAITVLANLGKMFPVFCYRSEADWRERLALCIGMWPRGEVGAGVLVVSLGYGIGGVTVAVATLCLALNLLCTGLFIYFVKALLRSPSMASAGTGSTGLRAGGAR
jgi:Kef-type K+ transport system membrane component KefB